MRPPARCPNAFIDRLFGAVLQIFFIDREDRSCLDLNARDDAGPSALVDNLHVIGARGRIRDFQAFVVIDRMILVVVGLVPAPLVLAGRRKLQRRDCIGRQVPELGILCRRACWNEYQNKSYQSRRLAHRLLLPGMLRLHPLAQALPLDARRTTGRG